MWEVYIPFKANNLFMLIRGNSIALQDCFIADCMFLLSYVALTFSQNPHYVTMTTQNKDMILFDWQPCFPATVVTVSYWETLFTKDAFISSEKIRIPPNILTDEERQNIQDVAITKAGIVILTAGFLYLRTEDDFIKLDKKFGIPPSVTGVGTRTYCWPNYTPQEGIELSEMVLWTENEVILGYSKKKFKSLITISKLVVLLNKNASLDSFSIHFVTYTSDPSGIAVMIQQNINFSQDILYLIFYDENKLLWSLQEFYLDFPHGKKLSALFMYSALPNFVIWDDNRVYYSYENYSRNGYMKINGHEDLEIIGKNSSIAQVFIDYFGNGVIKLQDNTMFYFKVELTKLIELHRWTNKNDSTLFLINPGGELFLANLNFGTAQYSAYPLMLELYSSTYKYKISCPYMLFESSILVSNVYLDKGKELTFWVQIIYPSQFGLNPIVDICGKKILKETRYMDYEINSGISTKNLTLTYYQGIDYEGRYNYYEFQEENMGNLMIQLRPSDFGTTCPLSNYAVHVFVGCVLERHIELKGYKENICQYKNTTYMIEKQYLSGDSPKDKIIYYDVTQYGCPLKIPMLDTYKPVLLLYDGPDFVEEVEANFVIWEIHGREDFGYTLDMDEAGCVNEAQTWESMKAEYKDLPMDEVWGPHNYRHCFSFSLGKPGDLTKAYEIFNLSNENEIIWENHHVGFYVFQAQVIDPNYRTDPYIVGLYLLAVLFVIIVSLIISYFWYLKIFRKYIYEPSLESKRKKKRKH